MEFFGADSPTTACPHGRRLALYFTATDSPELDRLEFRASRDSKPRFLQRGLMDDPERGFKADKVSWAIGIFILDYLCASLQGKGYIMEGDSGSPAATFGYAIEDKHRQWHKLFRGESSQGGEITLMKALFLGTNFNGKCKGARVIYPNQELLPPKCIEVHWNMEPLSGLAQIQKLTDAFRQYHNLPPAKLLILPKPEAPASVAHDQPQKQPEVKTPEATSPKPKSDPKPPSQQEQTKPESKPAAEAPAKASFKFPKLEMPPPPAINPNLFLVKQNGRSWPDDTALLGWGEETAPCVWNLRNAFEGVLVLGATGSGKTSGSGVALADAFLRAGFGGLVMTVKTNEAEHWRKLCDYCGRTDDLVVVERGGNSKLNILGYEAQRPGQGSGLSENLVALCHNLLAMSAHNQKGQRMNEQFWHNATNQLLNATFDLFLLAGESITFDRLAEFVSAAPVAKVPETEDDWLKVPTFGEILMKAVKAVESTKSNEDIRILQRTTDYWCKIFPGLAGNTRTSITLGVFAMLDAFRGRDIPDLISSETNVTPESIMSGKIVVLNLPLKEMGHTGLLVQSSWKYLFQLALERQAGDGDEFRRPVFLWEDEAQYFFSEHDHHFQDTARSARVSRVLLTQNLPNFYKAFGQDGRTIASSVFGNLNTKIFHANSDPETNLWSSSIFGQEKRPSVSISHNRPQGSPSNNAGGMFGDLFNPTSGAGISTTGQWEPSVRPEEFNNLRNGGPDNDYQVDAFITWIGHQGDEQRHFSFITFNQNPHLA